MKEKGKKRSSVRVKEKELKGRFTGGKKKSIWYTVYGGGKARPVIFLLSTGIFREAARTRTNVFDVEEGTGRNARKCRVKVKLGDRNCRLE